MAPVCHESHGGKHRDEGGNGSFLYFGPLAEYAAGIGLGCAQDRNSNGRKATYRGSLRLPNADCGSVSSWCRDASRGCGHWRIGPERVAGDEGGSETIEVWPTA